MSMNDKITIAWTPERGEETTVVVSPGFKSLDGLAQADCLKDAIYELEKLYNKARRKMRTDFGRIRRNALKKGKRKS